MAKRYQRGNQNLYIKEEQTTQWPKDTKGAIRICISKKNRQHNGQKIPKGQSESVYQRRTNNTMAKRYQRGNQNLYIKEEQTTQWPKDTKGAIRIYISTFGIFWPLCCLFFFDIQILIAPLVSFGHCVVCSSLIYRF
jgi:phage FluMu protein Com